MINLQETELKKQQDIDTQLDFCYSIDFLGFFFLFTTGSISLFNIYHLFLKCSVNSGRRRYQLL